MPNVTYITFKKLPNLWYTFTNYTTINNLTGINSTKLNTNIPSDVILLIEEQNENIEKIFHGNKYAIGLMIAALLIILCGFCCICNWYNQNSKIITPIIPRNENILLGHDQQQNNIIKLRRRRSVVHNNDAVIGAECNNNNNNNNNKSSNSSSVRERSVSMSDSAQQVRRNRCLNATGDNYDVEWGINDRTNPSSDQTDVLRRFDLDVESLPSYTLCSGLPSYDAALEEFRKAGIILTTTPSVVKIFENPTSKEHQIGSLIFNNNDPIPSSSSSLPTNNSIDNNEINLNSCKCGGSSTSTNINDGGVAFETNPVKQQSSSIESIIELSPEQLNMLSEKRLSLQIAFNSSIRRIQPTNRPIDLRREVLRSHEIPAAIHRSSSLRLIPRNLLNNESQQDDTRPPKNKNLHLNMNRHRGSIV